MCQCNWKGCRNAEYPLEFVVDSGATHHLVEKNYSDIIQDRHEVCHEIKVAKKGESIVASTEGNIQVKSETGKSMMIKDVWVCENLLHNLLSVKKLEENGLEVKF